MVDHLAKTNGNVENFSIAVHVFFSCRTSFYKHVKTGKSILVSQLKVKGNDANVCQFISSLINFTCISYSNWYMCLYLSVYIWQCFT